MASYKNSRFRFLLYGLASHYLGLALLLALLFTNLVHAQQGNDFPGGGFPTYPAGSITNFPVNGGQWNWGGTKWGPAQIDALRGDTIVFDVVGDCSGCYWRFAYPLHATPIISAGNDLQLLEPYTDGPKWQHWLNNGDYVTFCVGRCRFTVVAGEDYPQLWLGYDGNSDWYNQIEIQYIIPRPVFSNLFNVLRPDDKLTAAAIGNSLGASAGAWTGFALGIAPYSRSLSVILAAMAYAGDKMGDIYKGWAKDPFDWNYCTPVEWPGVLDQQTVDDLAWTNPYMADSNGWLTYSAETIITAGKQAQIAIDRALSAAQVADAGDSSARDCAYQRRGEALGYIHLVGEYMWYFRWSVEVSANAQQGIIDPVLLDEFMYSYLGELGWAATWAQGVQ